MCPASGPVMTAAMGRVFLGEQPGRTALRLTQEDPAHRCDGGESQCRARGAGERGAVPEKDHGDEDATERRPADHVRGGFLGGLAVSGHALLPGDGYRVQRAFERSVTARGPPEGPTAA